MGYIQELRTFVGSRPLIMNGSCVVVVDQEGRLLLQLRADNGKWGLPGGAMELGESFEETASRELLEETGIQAENMELLDITSGKDLYFRYPNGDEVYMILASFVCNTYSGALSSDDDEVLDIRFFEISSLPDQLHIPDVPVIYNYIARSVR